MKTLLTLALTLLSLNAQAAIPATIFKLERFPGFERFPQKSVFYVLDDGKMYLDTESLRGGEGRKQLELGTLSEEAVRALQQQVESIDESAALIDLQKDQPRCTDAPSYRASVFYHSGKLKVIGENSGCHSFRLEGSQGKSLIELGFLFIHAAHR